MEKKTHRFANGWIAKRDPQSQDWFLRDNNGEIVSRNSELDKIIEQNNLYGGKAVIVLGAVPTTAPKTEGPLVLTVGKTYLNKGGRVVKIVEALSESHPLYSSGYRFLANNQALYTHDGHRDYACNSSAFDLVKEVIP